MTSAIISVCAIVLYLLAAARTANTLRSDGGGRLRMQGLGLGFAAIAVHAVLLYQGIVTASGLNLSLFSTASLVAWVVAVLVLAVAAARPLHNAVVVLLPVAALAIGADLVFPGRRILPHDAPAGLTAHVAISIVAYSILTIAAIQALMLAFAEHRLRHKRPTLVINLLPPLQTMEELLFQLLAVGVFVLGLGLVAGFMFVDDLFAQHLVHKTVLSVIAWLIFAVLLWGRHHFGWRGRLAVRYTLAGFIVLALGFFGSKLVLELILERV